MMGRSTHHVISAADDESGTAALQWGRLTIEAFEDGSAMIICQCGPDGDAAIVYLSPWDAMGVLFLRDVMLGIRMPTPMPGWITLR